MAVDYLFIRLMEACNAGCFMCDYAFSNDKFRLASDDLNYILMKAKQEGIKYIRFTGGEPLLHKNIINFLQMIRSLNMKSSIITNGKILPRKINELTDAGLDQVIVSIDSPFASQHDEIRKTKGLFEDAINGLKLAKSIGIKTRVNTVCGPDNFRSMMKLQDLLTEIGILQWELSSLKLERPLFYSSTDLEDLQEVINYVYIDAKKKGRLVPLGKIWCGNTEEERQRYFKTGITPRADRECRIVHKVRYLDAKNKRLYSCSLIPHRPKAELYAASFSDYKEFEVNNSNIDKQVEHFNKFGPSQCTGCSATAAGCSNSLLESNGESLSEWYY